MKLRWIALSAALGCGLAGPPALANEMTFTGVITSGIDYGALFSPIGTNLAGDKVTVSFEFPAVPPGTTYFFSMASASVTIGGATVNVIDNDVPTDTEIDPPNVGFNQVMQDYDLGFLEAGATLTAAKPFMPADADLNSVVAYHVQPGDSGSGHFSAANESTPDNPGPPGGGPGIVPPWGERLDFTVNGFFLNTAPTAAIPEPGAWVLMLAGLFGLGGALRSARRPVRGAATA